MDTKQSQRLIGEAECDERGDPHPHSLEVGLSVSYDKVSI